MVTHDDYRQIILYVLCINQHFLILKSWLQCTAGYSAIPASQYIDSYTIAPRLDCQLDYASIAIWCFKCRSQLAYFDAREGIILVGYNRRRLHMKVIAGESIPRWVTRRDMVTKSDMVITGARKGPPLRLFFLGHAHQIHTAYVQPHDLQGGVTPKLHLQLPVVALNLALAPTLSSVQQPRAPPNTVTRAAVYGPHCQHAVHIIIYKLHVTLPNNDWLILVTEFSGATCTKLYSEQWREHTPFISRIASGSHSLRVVSEKLQFNL